jgi:hypothetical protein
MARSSHQRVVAGAAVDRVIAGFAPEKVFARAAGHLIGASAREYYHVVDRGGPIQRVVIAKRLREFDRVSGEIDVGADAGGPIQCIVPCAAID